MSTEPGNEGTKSRATLKVFVIECLQVVRIGLVSILREYPELRVVGEADNPTDALARMEQTPPDVVIIEPFTSGGGGVEAIARLQECFPDVKVVVLTQSDRRTDFVRAMRAGARAYLLKTLESDELIDSIRLVAKGRAVVYASKGAKLFDGPSNPGDGNEYMDRSERLTDREREILELVAQGASTKEVAAQCYVSYTTVKAHLRRISEKLDVRNRTQAVAIAVAKGFLDST